VLWLLDLNLSKKDLSSKDKNEGPTVAKKIQQREDSTGKFKDNATANPQKAANLADVDELRLSIQRLELQMKKMQDIMRGTL